MVDALVACRIKGPYYPIGDVDWTCITHDVEAVLRDPARYGASDIRRADFVCPITTKQAGDDSRPGGGEHV